MNNYIFFSYPANIELEYNLDFKIIISSKVKNFHQFLWKILSFGRMKEYKVMDGLRVIATAEIMPKIFIFQFMKKSGIHIGPCFTRNEYRNRGIYSNLLKKICNDYIEYDKYIFCSIDNISSKKGILKAGFEILGLGKKTKTGIYKLDTNTRKEGL